MFGKSGNLPGNKYSTSIMKVSVVDSSFTDQLSFYWNKKLQMFS